MDLTYEIVVQRKNEALEFQRVDRDEDVTDKDYREAVISLCSLTKARLDFRGISGAVLMAEVIEPDA